MTNKNTAGKSKYESPVFVPLGEMAKGSGACLAGSSVVNGGGGPVCQTGGTVGVVGSGTYCAAGPVTSGTPGYCTAGTSASVGACTAGTTATTACTAGVTATTAACTPGTFPGA